MFSLKTTLLRDGRPVSAQAFTDGLMADIRKAAEAEIERRLKAIRDPETGAPLKVTRPQDGSQSDWQLEGSPAAIEEARRILSPSADSDKE